MPDPVILPAMRMLEGMDIGGEILGSWILDATLPES
jgi:hypothetical protein